MIRRAVVPAYLALCIGLGGATLAGYLPNMVLQLLAIPIIFFSLLTVRRTPMDRSARALLILAALSLAVPLLQLVPLPPSVWTSLPGREPIAEGYRLLGQPVPWMPISLAPDRTLASVLWLLPAVAVLLGILRLGAFRASWIAWSILLSTLFAMLVGTLQLAGNLFYFYEVTNRGSAVGFFANANHMSTLLLVAIAFLAALFGAVAARTSKRRRSAGKASGQGLMFAAAMLVLLLGLVLTRSLAGSGLAVPVAGASFLLVWTVSARAKALLTIGLTGATIAAIAATYLLPIGQDLLEKEAGSIDSRQTSISRTLSASLEYMPVGSGIGSFTGVYRSLEDPMQVTSTWMNHAHSDHAELFLETGIPGIVLLLLFLVWWARQARIAWSPSGDLFARAASIASAAIMTHSLVDYPLRTAAISAIFAACCALMTVPREKGAAKRGGDDEAGPRHLTA
jgi:O-antigen ligase